MRCKVPTNHSKARAGLHSPGETPQFRVQDAVQRAPLLGATAQLLPCESTAAPGDPILARPSEAILGSRARPVFAADPLPIASVVELRKDLRIIPLALVRLAARGDSRDLRMADQR